MENDEYEWDNDDQQIIDQERAAELQRIADAEIARLDLERQQEQDEMDLNLNRVLADLEREMKGRD